METNFHNKNFALSLAFLMRFTVTRKWPIYLPTKHQRALGARSKVSVRSRSNWNLEMLVFVEGGKPEYPEETIGARTRTNNKLNPHTDANPGNQTRATLVEGECSHQCVIHKIKN